MSQRPMCFREYVIPHLNLCSALKSAGKKCSTLMRLYVPRICYIFSIFRFYVVFTGVSFIWVQLLVISSFNTRTAEYRKTSVWRFIFLTSSFVNACTYVYSCDRYHNVNDHLLSQYVLSASPRRYSSLSHLFTGRVILKHS